MCASRPVFHHLTGDLQALALKEISRVLKPRGRLVIADMASHAATHGHHLGARGSGSDPENKVSIEKAVGEVGFTGVESTRLMYGQIIAVAAINSEN